MTSVDPSLKAQIIATKEAMRSIRFVFIFIIVGAAMLAVAQFNGMASWLH